MKLLTTATALLFAASVGTPCNPRPQPTPRPTLPPVSTPTASVPTPIPPPVQLEQATRGKAIAVINAAEFTPRTRKNDPSDLDYYAATTFVWSLERGEKGPELVVPALELSLRGLDDAPCLSYPCPSAKEVINKATKETRTVGPHPMGVVARFSASTEHDSKEHDENKHVGEGIKYADRLPVGSWPLVRVLVEWDSSGVRVSPLRQDGSITRSAFLGENRGAPCVGFGQAFFPLPDKRGVGWAYEPFTVQNHVPVEHRKEVAWIEHWLVIENEPLTGCLE